MHDVRVWEGTEAGGGTVVGNQTYPSWVYQRVLVPEMQRASAAATALL